MTVYNAHIYRSFTKTPVTINNIQMTSHRLSVLFRLRTLGFTCTTVLCGLFLV